MSILRQIQFPLILLAAALALLACATMPAAQTPSPLDTVSAPIYGRSTGEIRTPITVLLVLSKTPLLDEPAQVALIITATQDAPGTTAEIMLPPGATAIDGSLTWTGDLSAGQSRQLQATIKFTQEGDWTVAGKALRSASGRDVWGDLAVIYLHVAREATQAGFLKEPNAPRDGGQAPTQPLTTRTP